MLSARGSMGRWNKGRLVCRSLCGGGEFVHDQGKRTKEMRTRTYNKESGRVS